LAEKGKTYNYNKTCASLQLPCRQPAVNNSAFQAKII
jgi:hypothetical protein